MEKIYIHIDVNNAFLSWEAVYLLKNNLINIDIRTINSVISKSEDRRKGIVLAKSHIAKKNGIKTADTIYNAIKKSPGLKIFPPHYNFYLLESKKLFNLLKKYFEEIEIASIDECYIDYSSYKLKYGNEIDFCIKLKNYIYKTYGWTVNIGIANSKICAKMASDLLKPNKINTIYKDEVKLKMWPLSIDELHMVGKKTCEKLKLLKIETIGQLANFDKTILNNLYKNQAKLLYNYSNGIDIESNNFRKAKSNEISMSKTCDSIITNKKDGLILIELLCNNLTKRLKEKHCSTSVIGITVKNINLVSKSKQIKIDISTDDKYKIIDISRSLFEDLYNDEPIKLIGIKFGDLNNSQTMQLSIFDDNKITEKEKKLNEAINKIREKYGEDIIK